MSSAYSIHQWILILMHEVITLPDEKSSDKIYFTISGMYFSLSTCALTIAGLYVVSLRSLGTSESICFWTSSGAFSISSHRVNMVDSCRSTSSHCRECMSNGKTCKTKKNKSESHLFLDKYYYYYETDFSTLFTISNIKTQAQLDFKIHTSCWQNLNVKNCKGP